MSRTLLVAMALMAMGAVGAALYSQHVLGMQPCPWCIVQRMTFIAIAAAGVLGLLLRRIGAALALALSAAGVAAALYQHFVAAQAESCALSLADRIVGATGLDGRWPELFMATAACNESKAAMLGVPYELWSLALFVVLGAIALTVLNAKRR